MMRPPYGLNNKVVRDVEREFGLPQIFWSIDPLDWKDRNAQTVANRVIKQAKPGSIVLSHDLYWGRPTPGRATSMVDPRPRARAEARASQATAAADLLKLGPSAYRWAVEVSTRASAWAHSVQNCLGAFA